MNIKSTTVILKRTACSLLTVGLLSQYGFAQNAFLDQTGTALGQTDGTFALLTTDWDRDGKADLVALKKSGTDTHSTEIHVLSGASNFKNFILHTNTPLHETDDTFSFSIDDWNHDNRPDLIIFKKSNTDTNSTEVHIIGQQPSPERSGGGGKWAWVALFAGVVTCAVLTGATSGAGAPSCTVATW